MKSPNNESRPECRCLTTVNQLSDYLYRIYSYLAGRPHPAGATRTVRHARAAPFPPDLGQRRPFVQLAQLLSSPTLRPAELSSLSDRSSSRRRGPLPCHLMPHIPQRLTAGCPS